MIQYSSSSAIIDRLLDRNKTFLDASLWRNGGDGLPQQTVTSSDFYRLVLVTARIFLHQLIVLEGEIECHKRSIVKFNRAALFVPGNENGHKLSHVLADALNFHSSIGPDEFLSSVR
jgi:hypothetical protein